MLSHTPRAIENPTKRNQEDSGQGFLEATVGPSALK